MLKYWRHRWFLFKVDNEYKKQSLEKFQFFEEFFETIFCFWENTVVLDF